MSIEQAITQGITFKKQSANSQDNPHKVKTKARKTTYVKGAHGSGSAKMKASYRRQRANRHKNK